MFGIYTYFQYLICLVHVLEIFGMYISNTWYIWYIYLQYLLNLVCTHEIFGIFGMYIYNTWNICYKLLAIISI